MLFLFETSYINIGRSQQKAAASLVFFLLTEKQNVKLFN